jgi:hypothetical protein
MVCNVINKTNVMFSICSHGEVKKIGLSALKKFLQFLLIWDLVLKSGYSELVCYGMNYI